MGNPMILALLLALAGCSDPDGLSPHDEGEPAVDQLEANAPAAAKLALDGEGLRIFAVRSEAMQCGRAAATWCRRLLPAVPFTAIHALYGVHPVSQRTGRPQASRPR